MDKLRQFLSELSAHHTTMAGYYRFTFLMTDSICHSSLPRMVLEKVTLTTIQFRIYPHTKVDPMFQCVYISTPLKRCPYKSSATCLIYGESC